MKKHLLAVLLCVILGFNFVGCGSNSDRAETPATKSTEAKQETSTKIVEDVDKEEVKEPEEKSPKELKQEIAKQEVRVINVKPDYKEEFDLDENGINNIIRYDLVNDSSLDIKSIMIGFVGWDENGLPVNIVLQFDKEVDLDDEVPYIGISHSNYNIKAHSKSTDYYVPLDNDIMDAGFDITKAKAIVIGYTTYDNDESWENPLCEAWTQCYAGAKLK